LSRERLAVAADISISALISYERGNSVPSVDRAEALACALGVPLSDMLGELEGASAA
jgi:transcriptional regulator with XRE-family HTH domain